MSDRPRILVLAPLPYGRSSGAGGAVACWNALAALSHEFDIGIVTFCRDEAPSRAALEEMRGRFRVLREVPQRVTRFSVLRAKLGAFAFGRPEQATYFRSRAMVVAIESAIAEFAPDSVMVQFPVMAQYLAVVRGVPRIMDVQDAYSVSWYRRASAARGWLRRLVATWQWLSWVRYERDAYRNAEAVWTLTQQDRYGLTVFQPALRALAVGVPFESRDAAPGKQVPGVTVGFLASFAHEPNVDALAFLVGELAPRVAQAMPDVQFLVAGRAPPRRLVLDSPPFVRYLGFVEDVADFYAQCRVIVAPLRVGGGMKIKVAEALCHGKAIVSTSIGCEGLDIEPGVHAVLADDAVELAGGIVRLLSDDAELARMSAAARAFARDRLSIGSWLERVRDLPRRGGRGATQVPAI